MMMLLMMVLMLMRMGMRLRDNDGDDDGDNDDGWLLIHDRWNGDALPIRSRRRSDLPYRHQGERYLSYPQ